MESTQTTKSSFSEEDTIKSDPTHIENVINILIDIYNSINKTSLLNINISKLNQQCLKTEIKAEKESTLYKYLCIVIVPITFFSLDEVNIKFNHMKLKEYIGSLIRYSVNTSVNKQVLLVKFKSFLKQTSSQYDSIIKTTKNIIKLVYGTKNEYATLKKCTNQLIENCSKLSITEIQSMINNTILYCHDMKHKIKINIKTKVPSNNNNTSLIPQTPFITSPLNKKFCLVLDMDETLSHSINLPFGSYFLMRPYVVEFLSSLFESYEIIIFTSSPQSYADNILNKIDIENKFIEYRLYRKHTCYVNNKTVKDLSMIGRELTKTILVDNIKDNGRYQKENLVHIKTWEYDLFDKELSKLKESLLSIVNTEQYDNDVRPALKKI